MPAGKLDLVIEQGATFKHTLLVKQTDAQNCPAVDLTGFTARMQVRQAIEAPDPLIELTTANGRILITPLEGRIDMIISAQDSALLNFDDCAVYDLEIESAGGEVTRLVRGSVRLIKEVTR